MNIQNINPLGFVGLVGAIILIVGVFLNWWTMDAGALGSDSMTGWEIFTDIESDELKYTFAPLLCLVVGVLSLILIVVPIVMNNEAFGKINNILEIVVLILSIVTVVICFLFYSQKLEGWDIALHELFDFAVGFWLCIAGGIITAVGGILPIVKDKLL